MHGGASRGPHGGAVSGLGSSSSGGYGDSTREALELRLDDGRTSSHGCGQPSLMPHTARSNRGQRAARAGNGGAASGCPCRQWERGQWMPMRPVGAPTGMGDAASGSFVATDSFTLVTFMVAGSSSSLQAAELRGQQRRHAASGMGSQPVKITRAVEVRAASLPSWSTVHAVSQ
ncbi:hypothetical protein Dimus_010111, partial [Dionaea muscipula]